MAKTKLTVIRLYTGSNGNRNRKQMNHQDKEANESPGKEAKTLN